MCHKIWFQLMIDAQETAPADSWAFLGFSTITGASTARHGEIPELVLPTVSHLQVCHKLMTIVLRL
jgi:hypothetical protein